MRRKIISSVSAVMLAIFLLLAAWTGFTINQQKNILASWRYGADYWAQLQAIEAMQYQLQQDRLEFEKQKRELELEREAILNAQAKMAEELEKVWGRGELKDFGSMENLLLFLAEDKTDTLQYYLEESDKGREWVCTHYSMALMRAAAFQGYRLYPTLVFLMCGNQFYGSHMMCFAIIEKEDIEDKRVYKHIVMIEPQTDEVLLLGKLYDTETWVKKWYKFLP